MKLSNLALIGMVLFFLPFVGWMVYLSNRDYTLGYGYASVTYYFPVWVQIPTIISAVFAVYWLYLIKKE